jgi:hypothetical protein
VKFMYFNIVSRSKRSNEREKNFNSRR